MEFRHESSFWTQAISEYRQCCKVIEPLTMNDIRNILFDFHDFNFVKYYKKGNDTDQLLYINMRIDYFQIFEIYQISEFIHNEFQNLLRCKGCKPEPVNLPFVYCITISPPKEHEQCLDEVVNKIINSKSCINSYGIYERGRTSNLYHTHFFIQYKDKDGFQNLKKFLKYKGNNKMPLKFNYEHKDFKASITIDKMGGPVHLLKSLRYFHQEDKKNEGFIGSLNPFEEMINIKVPIKFNLFIKENLISN